MSASNRILLVALCASALAGCNCGELPLEGEEDTGGTVVQADGGAPKADGSIVVQADGSAVPTDDAGNPVEDDGGAVEPADGGELADASCPAMDCTGLCGPVRDFCTGKVLQCGGCTNGLVCELDTHVCMVPAKDCAALGAECGAVRNTCGERLNCGDCKDVGQECDRNTHRCVACSDPTCQDLGYQCGSVWLGCGPYSNLTDCGACPGGQTCNAAYHVCEPMCTPAADADVCAAVGAECGFVSNGCGGLADCGGCLGDEKCGARGIGNRCDLPELPNECVAAFRECGTLKSACGLTLDCGECTRPGDVCSVAGRCEPPCESATCDTTYAGFCGVGLPEKCTPGKTLDCPCPSGKSCDASAPGAVGSCVVPSGCDAYGATGAPGAKCSNGPSPAFPKGDNTNLACPCAGGGVCLKDGQVASGEEVGACCQNTNACAPNACNKYVLDTCTGAQIDCTCATAGTHCNTVANLCEQDHTCAHYGAEGEAGDPCSIGTSTFFPKNDTTNLACPCDAGGVCNKPGLPQMADPGEKGECCVNTVSCGAAECNVTKTNACTGASIVCKCTAAGFHCNNTNNTCEADSGCSKFTDGQENSKCSNGQSAAFPKGDGTNLTCPCSQPGAECFKGGSPLPNGSPDDGLCCVPDTCPANFCGTVTNHCTGGTTQCGCTAPGTHCNTANNQCESNLTCASYSATGAEGAVCSNGGAFSNGATPPSLLTCPCAGSSLVCSNGAAVVGGAGCGTVTTKVCAVDGDCNAAGGEKCVSKRCAVPCQTGTCCNNTVTCGANPNRKCNNATLKNACTGEVLNCSCDAGYYCDAPVDGTCRPYLTCAQHVPPANGLEGAPCSTSNNPEFARWPTPPGNCTGASCVADTTGRTCNCTGGRVCSVDPDGAGPTNAHQAAAGEVGSCCVPPVRPAGNVGDDCTEVFNACTGLMMARPCLAANHCDAGTGKCVANATCATYTNGSVGALCSNGNDPTDFPRFLGDPTGLTCRCTAGNCYKSGAVVSGATGGTCCTPPTIPAGNVGDACGPIADPCTGTNLQRNCASGNYCKNGYCAAYETCSLSYGANGTLNAPCTTSPNAAWPRGDGTNLTCGCLAGMSCSVDPDGVGGNPGHVALAGEVGACCAPYPVPPGNPGDDCTTITDPCTGQPLPRPCKAGNYCNASGKCEAYETCATYSATGAQGAVCSDTPNASWPKGDGTNLACPCSTASPYTRAACVGGTCTCNKLTPTGCGDNGKADGCGGTMVSTCTSPAICYSNACCTPPVCQAGKVGEVCGSLSACGQSASCACSTSYDGKDYSRNTCNASTHRCECQALSSPADCGSSCPWGSTCADGCGGTYYCAG